MSSCRESALLSLEISSSACSCTPTSVNSPKKYHFYKVDSHSSHRNQPNWPEPRFQQHLDPFKNIGQAGEHHIGRERIAEQSFRPKDWWSSSVESQKITVISNNSNLLAYYELPSIHQSCHINNWSGDSAETRIWRVIPSINCLG